jgi:hypothetical protein
MGVESEVTTYNTYESYLNVECIVHKIGAYDEMLVKKASTKY